MLYKREYGFDMTHEQYVADGIAKALAAGPAHYRFWIAEEVARRESSPNDPPRILGCIAIVHVSPQVAQLRWFYLEPEARGRGIGRSIVSLMALQLSTKNVPTTRSGATPSTCATLAAQNTFERSAAS